MMRSALLVFVFIGAGLGSAQAESVASTMKRFGMMGEWAIDCAAPAGNGRAARLKYVARSNGSVFHGRDFDDRTDKDEITSATISSEGLLILTVFYPRLKVGEQARTIAYRKLSPTSLRAIYNYDSRGEYSVKDGRFTKAYNGVETPVQHKCD